MKNRNHAMSTVQILGDEIAALPSGELMLMVDHLIRVHPTLADRLLSELNWGFMDLELAKEESNG
jgi:hypothetical protein